MLRKKEKVKGLVVKAEAEVYASSTELERKSSNLSLLLTNLYLLLPILQLDMTYVPCLSSRNSLRITKVMNIIFSLITVFSLVPLLFSKECRGILFGAFRKSELFMNLTVKP